jgi:hypothetical protein
VILRSVLSVCLCLALASPAVAQCVAPEVVARMETEQAFVQTRVLAGVPRPLVSRGVVRMDGDSVIWSVTDPFDIVTRVGPSGITQAIEGGPPEPVGAVGDNNPFFRDTGLVDLVRGQLSGLEARYSVKRAKRVGPDGWRLELTPRAASISGYISRIDIEGCTAVDAIAVRQSSGDVIEIQLKAASR